MNTDGTFTSQLIDLKYEVLEKVYEIDTDKCTQCIGHYDKPTCVSVCPIDCIKPDPENVESEDTLLAKFIRMHG